MTTRLLPRAEWDRLVGTELELAAPFLPVDAQVLVIESDGAIVGCWAAVPYVHVEGWWMHPDHRGKGAVGRRLISGMTHLARAMGASVVLTAALTEEVRTMITKAGGAELPGTHHVIPIGGA